MGKPSTSWISRRSAPASKLISRQWADAAPSGWKAAASTHRFMRRANARRPSISIRRHGRPPGWQDRFRPHYHVGSISAPTSTFGSTSNPQGPSRQHANLSRRHHERHGYYVSSSGLLVTETPSTKQICANEFRSPTIRQAQYLNTIDDAVKICSKATATLRNNGSRRHQYQRDRHLEQGTHKHKLAEQQNQWLGGTAGSIGAATTPGPDVGLETVQV